MDRAANLNDQDSDDNYYEMEEVKVQDINPIVAVKAPPQKISPEVQKEA